MSFNKIKTNRKRKGSISVILIIILFGSLLLAVNMETVNDSKLIEPVQLASINYVNIEPVIPTEPTEPTDPGEPTEPTDPGEPGEPTDPTEPTEPTDPGEPTEPTEPTGPGDTDYGTGTPMDGYILFDNGAMAYPTEFSYWDSNTFETVVVPTFWVYGPGYMEGNPDAWMATESSLSYYDFEGQEHINFHFYYSFSNGATISPFYELSDDGTTWQLVWEYSWNATSGIFSGWMREIKGLLEFSCTNPYDPARSESYLLDTNTGVMTCYWNKMEQQETVYESGYYEVAKRTFVEDPWGWEYVTDHFGNYVTDEFGGLIGPGFYIYEYDENGFVLTETVWIDEYSVLTDVWNWGEEVYMPGEYPEEHPFLNLDMSGKPVKPTLPPLPIER